MTKHSILPNAITLVRLLLVGPFVWLIYSGRRSDYFLALVIFIVAISTDVLDGYVARKLKCATDFGNVFDVLADHVLAIIALTILVSVGELSFKLGSAVICREFAAEILRFRAIRSSFILPHNLFGRIKFAAIAVGASLALLGRTDVIALDTGRFISDASLIVALGSGLLSLAVMWRAIQCNVSAGAAVSAASLPDYDF